MLLVPSPLDTLNHGSSSSNHPPHTLGPGLCPFLKKGRGFVPSVGTSFVLFSFPVVWTARRALRLLYGPDDDSLVGPGDEVSVTVVTGVHSPVKEHHLVIDSTSLFSSSLLSL